MKSGSEQIMKGYNSFIQDFISQGITRIAVPLFFMISGYLFFTNITKLDLGLFLVKFRKRLRTLVLPYILWSVYGLLFYFCLQSIPQSESFFSKELIRDYSFSEFLSTIFLNPVPYQLWFIKDLVVIIVFSPIIFLAVKYLKYFIVLFLAIVWYLGFQYVIFENEALLFFTIGAFFNVNNIKLQNNKLKNLYLWSGFLWITMIFLQTYLTFVEYKNDTMNAILYRSSILIGILFIWGLYDRLFENKDISGSKYFKIFSFSFFLFAFHEPILTIYKKGLYFLIGITEFNSLIIYILAPILTIVTCIVFGSFLKRTVPKFYYILTGGR